MKVLKEIVIVILSIVSFVCLVGYLFLFSTQNIISAQNVAKAIEHVEIKELIGDEGVAELDKSLKESGLPEGMAENILDNKELKSIIGEYTSDIFSSILLSDEVTTIDSKKVAKDLNNIVDIVVKEARKNGMEISNEDVAKAHEEINNNSEQIVSDVNKSIIDAKETIENDPENEYLAKALKKARVAYRNKNVYLIVSIVCVVIACLLKIKEYEFVPYLRNIGLTFGILLVMIGSSFAAIIDVIKVSIGEYEDVLGGFVKSVPNTFLLTGLLCIAIGIICLVGYIYIKKNYDNNNN